MQGNALPAGVSTIGSVPEDLSGNWWGRVLEDQPTGCYDYNTTYIPAVTYESIPGSACYQQGKQTITGYFTKVIPALTEAPPMPSAGVNGVGTYAGSVDEGQVYGPDGGSEFGAAPVGSQADPVNTAIGALVHSESDLGLASKTGSLSVNRFYTSADATEGPFGRGWSLGYDIRLTVLGTEAVLKAGTGQRIKFTQNLDGSFTAPSGATSGLVRNPDGTFTVTTRSGLVHAFDTAGRLTGLTDGSGRGPTYTYDGGGRLTQVTDGNRSISFTWDTATGRITGAQTSAGQSVTYSYTGGLLTGATNALSGTTTYTYDVGQRLAEIKAPSGRTIVRTAYDILTGRVSEQWDGLGNRSAFAWDAATSTATMTDPRGGVWKDIYAGNVLQRRVDPVGSTTDYEYDTQLRLIATHGPDGIRNALDYTPGGDVKSFQGTTRMVRTEYNAQHLPTTTTNARGYSSTRGYDAANNLTQLSRPNPAGGTLTSSLAYDGMGNVTSATDPNGNTGTFEYSPDGDPTKATSPLGFVTSMAYDTTGRVTSMVSPRGNALGADPNQFTWRYEYDALGRMVKATNPAGQYETVEYNADGQVTKATDTAGRSTAYQYDAAGHVTAVQGPDPNVPATTTAYDANGNITAVTDSMGRTTTFQYDAANRATTVTNPLGTYTLTYTKRNQIASVKDPQNAITSYTYDPAGRLTRADLPGTDSDVTYTYDNNGNRASMVDPNGTTTYAYDSLDRLTAVTRGGRTFTLAYDAASRLTGLTSPGGAVTGYTYDADGRVTEVKNGAAVVATYTHDPDGNTLTVTRADGSTATRAYNNLGQLTRITDATTAATLLDETYAYDAAGNPVTITRPDGTADTFTYDTLDRLTKACYTAACASSTEVLEWTYDHADNILTEIRNGQTTTHAYNTKGQRTQTLDPAAGTTDYTYDYRGQALTAGNKTFTYTKGGRTATTTTPAGTTTYKYDGDGRRLSATLGTAKTSFEWDPFYRLANELDTSGALLRHYTHGEQPLTAHDPAGAAAYFHTDRLGSVRTVTDATGAVTSAGAWEPYGRPRATGPNNPNAPPLGWLGQYQDPTGLAHLRARQYDPVAGMFLTPDPAASTSISGTYTYGSANPLRYIDITGLFSWDEALGGVQDISGIVSDVAGVLAIVALATGVGAPVAAVLGGISIAAGAVHAGTKAIQAYNTCNSSKGSCGDAVAEALLSTAAIVPGGRLIKGAAAGAKALSGASRTANTMAKACSFSGATVVLMADGSRKPIEDVKVGDKVIATDPETGEQVSKRVEHVFVHDDTVLDLVVDDQVITTTEDHPFWSVTDQSFERADQLESGEEVLGADGRTIKVSRLELGTARQAIAYNLEVEGIHTYHVGHDEILVHNTCKVRGFWEITQEGTTATKRGPYGTLSKSKSDGLWWSRDTAGHGGSVWKVYEESSRGLIWRADANQYGDFIVGKHKSDIGTFIPWKDLH
ncbi:polymorphic toxin-type HINT domain-containing protein [Arthrobacter sp. B10-11]|uniref:polymorphic toxin-type HINT domain-containing protein n=1 Tax=Arthrobacter sp. B10-11 TaxID=3081160 RepID=UPI0029556B43|nr:polymorphic toxin-type HINT domain-containing protein [Arthrobacter sp. B10-11]MDV8147433.1 polymorphic toxin-type HINT domain-containing protein [Arthrobacter sp. B10-11]